MGIPVTEWLRVCRAALSSISKRYSIVIYVHYGIDVGVMSRGAKINFVLVGNQMLISAAPKVFFDTQIVSQAERGSINSSDWSRACAYIRQTSRYCVSALTVTELLAALANGRDEFFDQHKRRLQYLIAIEPTEVFDFIPYFVGAELGLKITRPPHLEDDYLNTIRLILAAPSKSALLSGFAHPDMNQTVRINLGRFSAELEEKRNGYIGVLEERRRLGVGRFDAAVWAGNLIRHYGVVDEPQLRETIVAALSATYEFEMAVYGLLRNRNFDIAKNASDLVDGQQLCYLCSRETVFITNDSDYKTRTRLSAQSGRIKSFAELLECANTNAPLL